MNAAAASAMDLRQEEALALLKRSGILPIIRR